MDRYAVGLRFEMDAPHIGEQLFARQAHTRLLCQTPQQLEFARVKADPAIIDPPVAMEQIEHNITDLAKTRDQGVILGKFVAGC